ncbi:hypothetical protein EVAR_2772_1 [Eumeta japonica]|uniref:Uncharacterized protein n=1 Tax=Eumeta variegata TaxID=151549 RepID=A0A4C1T278_EUMVA|nr:hypothetical protein EVAR_2772_1 [Eumeta japonica]
MIALACNATVNFKKRRFRYRTPALANGVDRGSVPDLQIIGNEVDGVYVIQPLPRRWRRRYALASPTSCRHVVVFIDRQSIHREKL